MVYYTYAYLREDRSPYYIGKGKGKRVYEKCGRTIKPPKDKSRILILKQNLTEAEAFRHEVYMIAVYGRKDLGTGILHNRTNGGEGGSGRIVSEETRRKLSESTKGEKHPQYGKPISEESRRKNSKSNEKYHYTIYSIAEDKTYQTNTLHGFCREHLLTRISLYNTLNGNQNQHKGFKILKKESISALLN
jgi:hypothetical protein